MGLFNHLFKPRHNEAGEKAVEDNPSPAEGGKPAPPPDPTAFLQPKEFTPQAPDAASGHHAHRSAAETGRAQRPAHGGSP